MPANLRCLPHRHPLALAVSLAFLPATIAWAQAASPSEAAPEPAPTETTTSEGAKEAAKDAVGLDRLIITGTSTARTKMKQSVSVSTLAAEDIARAPVSSTAELLRAVPGVRSESTGGEANANLTVRGLPLSAGGMRYVQMQEDGLPVLLVGDISFSTPDTFVRADFFNDSIDVLRGGSAATLATNSPGGLINFITNNGKTQGGAFGYTLGLDYYQQRADFLLGTKLGAKTYLAVGGYQRIGEGTRNTDTTLEHGGQLRLSLMQELDNKGSYVRATFKSLDDHVPPYMEVPVQVVNGKVKALPGIDPREAYFVGSNWGQDMVRDRNGHLISTDPTDGVHAKSLAVGLEGVFKLDNDLTVTERMRTAKNSGRFISVFPAGSQPTDYKGTVPVFSVHLFNTSLDDMSNFFNDLRVQKGIQLGDDNKLTLLGGLFNGKQNMSQTWYWNRYNVELTDSNPRLFDNDGNVTTSPVTQGATWGYCCMRYQTPSITAFAPYGAVTWDMGPLSIDASVRYDKLRLSGYWINGNADNTAYDPATRTVMHNSTDATSYSVGGNYAFSKDLAAFARLSQGTSWASPDRTVVGNKDVSSGAQPIPENKIDELEVGLKYRQPGLALTATLFDAKTKEDGGFEVTSQSYLKDTYHSTGVEAEVQWTWGDFRLVGGGTFAQAKIVGGANDGKKPRRQAPFMYQISPSYTFDKFEVGAQVIGLTEVYADNANTVKLPGFAVVNAFANYEIMEGLTLQLGVNNLFNTIGFTEGEAQNNRNPDTNPGGTPIYEARSVNGRSVKATLKYTF